MEINQVNFNSTIELFINTIWDMYSDVSKQEIPKINFIFQKDAIEYFNYLKNNYFKFENRICQPIGQTEIEMLKESKSDSMNPTIVVENYEDFFNLLTNYSISMTSQRYNYQYVDSIKSNQLKIFKELWLRMTPSDFNDVNSFLKNQYLFTLDNTFTKYKNETIVGKFFDYDIVVNDNVGFTWDENNKAMEIRLVKDFNYHTLPVVRYDIKEESDGKVCYIGAIQNLYPTKIKSVERLLYKLNKDVDNMYLDDIYNGSLLSLIVFTHLLLNEGITKIKVPALHTISYDYHEILSNQVKEKYNTKWGNGNISKDEEANYEYETDWYRKIADKQDFICKAKTENLLNLFYRVAYHLPIISILNEPMIQDDYLNIKIEEDNLDLAKPDLVLDISKSISPRMYKR